MSNDNLNHLATLALEGDVAIGNVYATRVMVHGHRAAVIRVHEATSWNYLNDGQARLLKVNSTFALVEHHGRWHSVPRGLVKVVA